MPRGTPRGYFVAEREACKKLQIFHLIHGRGFLFQRVHGGGILAVFACVFKTLIYRENARKC